VAELITISEVARRSGVAASALRFYEERGLIASERNSAGHRRYPRYVIRRVAFVLFAQRIGLTLEQVGEELAGLPTGRAPKRDDWERLSATWRTRVDDQIAQLERLRESLTDCIGCGCLSLETCQMLNPDDRLGREGPGARRLL
jgi:MerR family redox-sensitive transcriptional activator SoxR